MFDLKGGAGSNLVDPRQEGIMQILHMINIKNPSLAHTFGTSRYVQFLPFGRFFLVKRHKFIHLEDPGNCYIYIYIDVHVFCLKSHVCTVQSMYIYTVFFEIPTTWIKTFFCTFILICWRGRGILFDRTWPHHHPACHSPKWKGTQNVLTFILGACCLCS